MITALGVIDIWGPWARQGQSPLVGPEVQMSLELVEIFRDHMRPLSVQKNTVLWFIAVTETESHKAGVSKFVFLTTPW